MRQRAYRTGGHDPEERHEGKGRGYAHIENRISARSQKPEDTFKKVCREVKGTFCGLARHIGEWKGYDDQHKEREIHETGEFRRGGDGYGCADTLRYPFPVMYGISIAYGSNPWAYAEVLIHH
jgi:hypothetical protein